MKISFTIFAGPRANRATQLAGSTAIVLICLALLIFAGILVYLKSERQVQGQPSTSFTTATTNALRRIDNPVELRLYSILDAGTADPALQSFADRVGQMVRSYQEASQGMVSIKVFDGSNDINTAAALAEGIRAFNIEKGDASFMGVVVESGGYKEVLPFLNPDFEAALEADITRAIARAGEAGKAVPGAVPAPELDPSVIESVKTTVPDYDKVTLEAGTRTIREAMLAELQRVGEENAARIAEAQSALERVQQSGSQAEQAAARKALSEAEHEHVKRLQEIVSRSTAQIGALEKLKSAER